MDVIPKSDRRARIAIIDNDPVFLRKLEDSIESSGWEPCPSTDLTRAASFVARSQPDLVIVDLGQGAERAAAWHALDVLKRTPETCGIPIVVCSAAARSLRTQARTLRQYGVEVLSKPANAKAVLRRVVAVLGRRQAPGASHRR